MKKIKIKLIFLAGLCFLAWLFVFPCKCSAEKPAVIINELMWMGSSASAADEWIELKNISDFTVNFESAPWSMYKNDLLMLVINKGAVKPGEYFLISNNSEDHKFANGESVLNIKPDFIDTAVSLSNSFAQYELYDKPDNSGNLIDIADDGSGAPLAGENGTVKKSMERNEDYQNGTIVTSWHTCYKAENLDDGAPDYATPSAQNSEEEKLEPKVYSDEIIINEILPNPLDDEENEFIELYNSGKEDVDLSGWTLKDAGKTSHYIFPADTIIKFDDYLVIYRKDFKFALNNSGDESVYLIDPNGEIQSQTFYSGSKENVSYNFDGNDWRWSRFLTPGEENQFNNLPESKTKNDKNVYVGVWADFSANAKDLDKDNLKYTWDFGDGHKSYKKNTRHKYEKTGKYTVTLKIFDGSEDKIEEFNINVKEFPRPKVKIVGVSANPKGNDSELEYIIVKNNSKKNVNLKDWSVATGSKNLYNHPITKDLIINPGKTAKITRQISKFTLNNKKSKIELRYPDGKVTDKMKYSKNGGGIEDDELYEKTDSGWDWNAPQETETPVPETQTSPASIADNEELVPQETNMGMEENAADQPPADSAENNEEAPNSESFENTNPDQNQSMVLGTSTEKENHPALETVKKRWHVKVLESINLAINKIVSWFF